MLRAAACFHPRFGPLAMEDDKWTGEPISRTLNTAALETKTAQFIRPIACLSHDCQLLLKPRFDRSRPTDYIMDLQILSHFDYSID